MIHKVRFSTPTRT